MIKKIYADDTTDFRRMKKYQLDALLAALKKDTNGRYGKPILKEILIERLDYMKADEVRAGGRKPAKPKVEASKSGKPGSKGKKKH